MKIRIVVLLILFQIANITSNACSLKSPLPCRQAGFEGGRGMIASSERTFYIEFIRNNEFNNAYLLCSQLRFKEANNIIAQNYSLKEMQFVKVYEYFIKSLIDDDANSEALFYKAITAYESAKNKNLSGLYYQYFDGQIQLLKCVISAKKQKYLEAGLYFKKAYSTQQNVLKENKTFAPALLSMGVMQSLIATAPSKYLTLINLVGFDGNFKTSLKEINAAALLSSKISEYNFIELDALLLKTMVEVNLTKQKSQVLATRNLLLSEKKKSPLLTYALCKSYEFTAENDSCIVVLLKTPQGKEFESFHYLDYLLGSFKLNRLDKDADVYLLKYSTQFKGSAYKQAVLLKLSWFYLLSNQLSLFDKTLNQIVEKDNLFLDEDKRAVKEKKYAKSTNVNLLKARLLFDGGYCPEALEALDLKNAPTLYKSFYEKMEMTYRLGRIYHRMGNHVKAKEYYSLVITACAKYDYYFAANAALMSGEIYEDEKDFVNAEKFYKQSIAFKNHDYENSIEQKAKAGLSRIGK